MLVTLSVYNPVRLDRREKHLLPDAEIDFISETVPIEIVRWQDDHRSGRITNDWPAFFAWLDFQCESIHHQPQPIAA